MGKQWKQCQTLFWGGSKITADSDCSHEIKRHLLLGRKAMIYICLHMDSILKSKGPYSQGYGFSSSHAWMGELDCKESWTPKNWCFATVVLEKNLESPLDYKEIKWVNPNGNQSWICIWGMDAKAETQYCGHLYQELTHWKRPWCWKRLKAGEEEDDRW